MRAWDGNKCIGQLHCYRLILPDGSSDHWPARTRTSYVADVLKGSLGIAGPVVDNLPEAWFLRRSPGRRR